MLRNRLRVTVKLHSSSVDSWWSIMLADIGIVLRPGIRALMVCRNITLVQQQTKLLELLLLTLALALRTR
jgi:hypothetical protein